MLIRDLLLLYTLNFLVVEPIVVKTVSKVTVSVEKFNLASGDVIIFSLLHEKTVIIKNKGIVNLKKDFIGIDFFKERKFKKYISQIVIK